MIEKLKERDWYAEADVIDILKLKLRRKKEKSLEEAKDKPDLGTDVVDNEVEELRIGLLQLPDRLTFEDEDLENQLLSCEERERLKNFRQRLVQELDDYERQLKRKDKSSPIEMKSSIDKGEVPSSDQAIRVGNFSSADARNIVSTIDLDGHNQDEMTKRSPTGNQSIQELGAVQVTESANVDADEYEGFQESFLSMERDDGDNALFIQHREGEDRIG